MQQQLTEIDFEIAISNGINRQLAWNRYYTLFWSKEDAISVPVGESPKWTRIAEENGIPLGTYYSRRNAGIEQERASTEPPTPKNVPSVVSSFVAIAESNGISRATYYLRVGKGMPPEEAATKPTAKRGRPRKRAYTDAQLEIANQHGISRQMLDRRLARGWHLGRAMTANHCEEWIRNHGEKAQMFVSRKQRSRKKVNQI